MSRLFVGVDMVWPCTFHPALCALREWSERWTKRCRQSGNSHAALDVSSTIMFSQSTPWLNVSKLEILITNACAQTLPEPNYARHLEVADYINTKKANS